MIGLSGCASQPPVAESKEVLPFDRAIVTATDAVFEQSGANAGFLDKLGSQDKRVVVLDPSLDADTGQQTAATQQLDRAIEERVAQKYPRFDFMPFQSSNFSKAQYLLVGSLSRVEAQGAYRLSLALLELKTGTVVAQSSALARQSGMDMKPLNVYRDSPVLLKDETTDGYVRTSTTAAGKPADPAYLSRIATATQINDAAALYNAARYREALAQYRSVLATPSGNQIRVLNGIYLSSAKLGRTAEAEEAFGRLVAFGIAQKNLSVKFLFNPGSTEFWADPRLTGAYTMWLRQIGKQASGSKVCMDVVGHTSSTGPESVNDSLSAKRAAFIRQRLSAEAAELTGRTKAVGMGSRHNIVGSGTDDVVDALDRRVDFAIVDCVS